MLQNLNNNTKFRPSRNKPKHPRREVKITLPTVCRHPEPNALGLYKNYNVIKRLIELLELPLFIYYLNVYKFYEMIIYTYIFPSLASILVLENKFNK